MITLVGSPPPACSYIAACVCCGGVQSAVWGSAGEGGGRSGLVEGKQRSDLPFLSVCPQLRAGTARSALPADDQIFKSGWGTTTAERRASRQAAPTQAYLSGYPLSPARDQDECSSPTTRSAPRPWSHSQLGVPPLGAAPMGGGRRHCLCTPDLAMMNPSALSLSIRP